MSDLNTITTSPEFPEDYGDFKLISSDNVAFHFSRFLLSYQSSVFKGMFAVGESYVHQPDELLLTEDSNTLDCLLQYLDPKKVPTPPTVQSVQPLLEACRKYDIPTVAKRWEEQLMTVWRASPDLDETISRPFECLALASRFNLNLLARFALRELTKAPIAQLKTDVVFENWISMHLISLRAARVDWFERKFAAFLNSIPSAACNQTQSHVWMYIAVIKIIQELHKEPSWKTIRGHFNAWYVCTSCRKFEGASAVLNAWGADIAALEAEIPDLPSRL